MIQPSTDTAAVDIESTGHDTAVNRHSSCGHREHWT